MDILCFIPLHNSYRVLDVILVADGELAREFRTSREVRDALLHIGVPIADIESEIEGLNQGWIFEVEISPDQRARFYGLANRSQDAELMCPIQ
jgi:hypothetical protein